MNLPPEDILRPLRIVEPYQHVQARDRWLSVARPSNDQEFVDFNYLPLLNNCCPKDNP